MTLETINLDLGDNSYDILIKHGLLDNATDYISKVTKSKKAEELDIKIISNKKKKIGKKKKVD